MLACFIVCQRLCLLEFGDSEAEYTFVRLLGVSLQQNDRCIKKNVFAFDVHFFCAYMLYLHMTTFYILAFKVAVATIFTETQNRHLLSLTCVGMRVDYSR